MKQCQFARARSSAGLRMIERRQLKIRVCRLASVEAKKPKQGERRNVAGHLHRRRHRIGPSQLPVHGCSTPREMAIIYKSAEFAKSFLTIARVAHLSDTVRLRLNESARRVFRIPRTA